MQRLTFPFPFVQTNGDTRRDEDFLAAKENPMGEDVTERNTTPSRLRDGWIPEKLPHEDETLQQQSILKLTNHSWTSCI